MKLSYESNSSFYDVFVCVSWLLMILLICTCSQYEADNEHLEQVDDFVDEDGSQNHRQPPGTSVDGYDAKQFNIEQMNCISMAFDTMTNF